MFKMKKLTIIILAIVLFLVASCTFVVLYQPPEAIKKPWFGQVIVAPMSLEECDIVNGTWYADEEEIDFFCRCQDNFTIKQGSFENCDW